MNFQIPSVIFVPLRRTDKATLCVADPVPLFSRWSEAAPSANVSPPKFPRRRLNKADFVPKLPQRCGQNVPDVSSSSRPLSSAGSQTTRLNLEVGCRQVRPIPRPRGSVADSSTSSSSTDTNTTGVVSLVRGTRSGHAQGHRFSASAIVERVHQKTSRPGPELRQVLARAA
jgi:hypothetical protein